MLSGVKIKEEAVQRRTIEAGGGGGALLANLPPPPYFCEALALAYTSLPSPSYSSSHCVLRCGVFGPGAGGG
jgi:hypothetical protein